MSNFNIVARFSSPTANLDPVVIKNGEWIR